MHWQNFYRKKCFMIKLESKKIAYVLERFPSPTEYFILNEILELEKNNIDLVILVLKKQRAPFLPDIKHMNSKILYLSLFKLYLLMILSFYHLIIKFSFQRELSIKEILREFKDDCVSKYYAIKLRAYKINHVHAHFAFVSTNVAKYLSKRLNIRFSFTAHANDIYTNKHKIKEYIQQALFVITCTQYNLNYLNILTGYQFKNKIHSAYHGIEIDKWINRSARKPFNNSLIRILSIGRLIEKKGLIYLLKAIKKLGSEGFKIKCTIVGEGPLKPELTCYICKYNLEKNIQILSFVSQEKLLTFYQNTDVFVLPCVIAENNDRDGLPNVILESMLMGIPVITTNTSAITEAITDKKTGLIVNQRNDVELANAIKMLYYNTNLYTNISRAGNKLILHKFNISTCTIHLIDTFRSYLECDVK